MTIILFFELDPKQVEGVGWILYTVYLPNTQPSLTADWFHTAELTQWLEEETTREEAGRKMEAGRVDGRYAV